MRSGYLPTSNQVLQSRIRHPLKRPVGRPPNEVLRYYANFTYQAGSWTKPYRVIAKVEWHPGELYPRVGFIVTNMSRPAVHHKFSVHPENRGSNHSRYGTRPLPHSCEVT